MDKRTFKDKIYNELASVVKSISNPHRLEILELLAQGPFSVDEIASETDLTVANASQHLQVLKRSQLVETRKESTYVYYQLADQNVYRAWKALRDLGIKRIAEIERIIDNYRNSQEELESITTSELIDRIQEKNITVIDVRTEKEFKEGHISDAKSIPLEQLNEHLKDIPTDQEIVAYCRGPFCVLADEAVKKLNEQGYKARRLDEGFPEWQLNGLPTESSNDQQ